MFIKDVLEALDVALSALLFQQAEFKHSLNTVYELDLEQDEKNRRVDYWKTAIEKTEKAYLCLINFSVVVNKSKELEDMNNGKNTCRNEYY